MTGQTVCPSSWSTLLHPLSLSFDLPCVSIYLDAEVIY